MLLGMAVSAPAQTVQHVHYQMLADVSAVTPGKPFRIGVRLSIDPGWHVYWTNPGDAGLPTKVTFSAPDGFAVGSVQFPTPVRMDEPGNISLLGYENSVLITALVTPPSQLPGDFSGKFGLAVSWLVCSDECIPGKGADSIVLPASQASSPANTDLFDDWARQAPVDVSQSADVAAVNCSGSPGASGSPKAMEVRIDWKGAVPASVQFLPELNDVYNIGPVQVKSTAATTWITFTVETMAGKTAGQKLQAVVGYENQSGERRGVIVPVFIPGSSS
jgi:thiol:disulfide interchange protein DsbD